MQVEPGNLHRFAWQSTKKRLPESGRRSRAAPPLIPFLLSVATFLLFAPALALDPDKQIAQYRMDNWTPDEGLVQITVLDVLQDADGYIWAATQDGLSRFDGQRFRNFDAQAEPAMGHSYIKAIAEDGAGRLWVGTLAGLVYRLEGGFHDAHTGDADAPSNIHDIAVDEQGVAWAAADTGLYRLAEGRARRHYGEPVDDGPFHSVSPSSRQEVDVWAGAEGEVIGLRDGPDIRIPLPPAEDIDRRAVKLLDTGAVLWIGTNQGLFRYRDGKLVAIPRPAAVANRLIEALWKDRDGILWIGTEVGLFRHGANAFDSADHPLADRIVNAVLEDREGNLWIGTNSLGLVRLWNGKFTRFDHRQGLEHPMAWAVAEEPGTGTIWVGTSSGVYTLREGRFFRGLPIDALPHPTVQGIHWDSRQRLWLLTRQGLAVYRGGEPLRLAGLDGIPPEKMYSLLEEPSGTFWIGSQKGLYRYRDGDVTHFGNDHGLPEAVTRNLAFDHRGRLWVATDEGLYRGIDHRFGKAGGEVELDRTVVFDIEPTDEDEIWFATYGKGIARYRDGRYSRWSIEDGLHVETVFQIERDDRNRFWLSSSGIAILDRSQFDAYEAGEREALEPQLIGAGNAIEKFSPSGGNAFTSLRASDGRFYYPTAAGLVRVDPNKEVRNLVPPKIVVETVQRGDRLVDVTDRKDSAPIAFPPGDEAIEIRYAGLTFRAPELARYRYRLTPFDDEWVDPGTRSVAYYTNLPPGRYRFEVEAMNGDGIRSAAAAGISLDLEPFYYQTGWFRTLMVLAFLLLVYLAYRWRMQSFRLQRARLERLVEQRTRELEKANARLEEASLTDALTGLPNRRFLADKMAEDAALARRACREGVHQKNRDIVLVMMDLDHFKAVNDNYGHHAGDDVLTQLAAILRKTARESDYVVRWGGEEFLVVARFAERDSALALAERFRRAVADAEFELDEGTTLSMTCSIGFVCYPLLVQQPNAFDWEQTVDFADLALYVAKSSGRDRCVGIYTTEQTRSEDLLQRAKGDLDRVVGAGELELESAEASNTSTEADPV